MKDSRRGPAAAVTTSPARMAPTETPTPDTLDAQTDPSTGLIRVAALPVTRRPNLLPMQALQRTVGNRAVNRLLAQRTTQVQRPNRTGIPDALKASVESLSGISLDQVNVHYNSSEPARRSALAYTYGRDIHLAPGQKQHLPHEAWHVVQQAQGRVQPTIQRKDALAINADQGLEREADIMGAQALADSVQRASHAAEHTAKPVLQPKDVTHRAAVLQRKELRPDMLNVAGETHDAVSADDRIREERLTRTVVDSEKTLKQVYWQEFEFTVSADSPEQADPIYGLIAHSIYTMQAPYNPQNLIADFERVQAAGERAEEPESKAPEIDSSIATLVDSLGVDPSTVKGDEKVEAVETVDTVLARIPVMVKQVHRELNQLKINLAKGGPGTDGWTQVPEPMRVAVQAVADRVDAMQQTFDYFVNEYPYEDDAKARAADFHDHLAAVAAEFAKAHIGSLVDSRVARSQAMHKAAQNRHKDVGVWKIGDTHVGDLKAIEKNDPLKYNLLSEIEFNDALKQLNK